MAEEEESLPAADTLVASDRVVLHPPGAGTPTSKAERFAALLAGALQPPGRQAELTAVGTPALWHSLRALCVGPTAADFEVAEVGDGDGRQAVRILARQGGAWEDFNHDISRGCFVSKSTQTMQLAKKLVFELQRNDVVTLHTYADAEIAVGVILKAIASARSLGHHGALRCSAGSIRRDGENVPRVMVHVQKVRDPPRGGIVDFVAYPPGGNVELAALKVFGQTVRSKLAEGRSVVMECRGRDATSNAVAALASVPVRVGQFRVEWIDAFVGDEADPTATRGHVPRALKIRAASGETWPEFNATDFARSRRLTAGVGASVKELAARIGSEVRSVGAVAVHAYAENLVHVFTAIKAIASVPTENNGLQVECVPSLGKSTDKAGGEIRSLRLYVRRPAGSGSVGSRRQRARARMSFGEAGRGGRDESGGAAVEGLNAE